jgi:hypothetical protein
MKRMAIKRASPYAAGLLITLESRRPMAIESATSETEFTGSLLAAVVLIGALAVSVLEAGAVSIRTKLACRTDYRSYCSSFKMGSNELRQCMSANGPKLSKKCINALVADGEISEAEVARRAADLR